jgi:hypothetical protein
MHSYKVGVDSAASNKALLSSTDDGFNPTSVKGGVLGTSSFEQYYVMFTGNENYSKLSNSSEPVGTLKITIEQAN